MDFSTKFGAISLSCHSHQNPVFLYDQTLPCSPILPLAKHDSTMKPPFPSALAAHPSTTFISTITLKTTTASRTRYQSSKSQ